MTRQLRPAEPATYQIKVEGKLNKKWADWFSGMEITSGIGDGGSPITVLTGVVADQSALRGILTMLWDLNLILISANRVETDSSNQIEAWLRPDEENSHGV